MQNLILMLIATAGITNVQTLLVTTEPFPMAVVLGEAKGKLGVFKCAVDAAEAIQSRGALPVALDRCRSTGPTIPDTPARRALFDHELTQLIEVEVARAPSPQQTLRRAGVTAVVAGAVGAAATVGAFLAADRFVRPVIMAWLPKRAALVGGLFAAGGAAVALTLDGEASTLRDSLKTASRGGDPKFLNGGVDVLTKMTLVGFITAYALRALARVEALSPEG